MTRAFASEHHYVRVDVERDQVRFTALRPDGSTLDRATLRHEGWTDAAPVVRDRPPAPTGVVPPGTPEPPEDFTWLWKVVPVAVAVGAGAWWLRRRSR